MFRRRPKVRVVTVPFGMMGKPHEKNIERVTRKWMKKGYALQDTQHNQPTPLKWGNTTLTFVRE